MHKSSCLLLFPLHLYGVEMAFWGWILVLQGWVGPRQPQEQRHQCNQRQTCGYGAMPLSSYKIVTYEWDQSKFTKVDCLQKFLGLQYLNNNDRPDIVIFDTGILCDVEIAISFAHPRNREICRNSSRVNGFETRSHRCQIQQRVSSWRQSSTMHACSV